MSGSTVRLFLFFCSERWSQGRLARRLMPEYMKVSVGHPATTKDEIAQRDVLALNDTQMNSSRNRVRKKS